MFKLLSKQIKTAPGIIANDYTQKERMKQKNVIARVWE